MKPLKIHLSRNLRRSVLQGHPWIYKESIEWKRMDLAQKHGLTAQLCLVLDSKGPLAWAIFDPHSPLALRILSTNKDKPNGNFFLERFARAAYLRKWIQKNQTNAFRLFNGEGDGLPGLVCDIYNDTAVLQLDGKGPEEFWDLNLVENWILDHTSCRRVLLKQRGDSSSIFINPIIPVIENGAHFLVDLAKGQKTGFFLDQRENRYYIRQISSGKNVLNLFSYTGGFSINAGLGSARRVLSVDISKGALESALDNWSENHLDPSKHDVLCTDAFAYLKNTSDIWDLIIIDPPNMSPSEGNKTKAKNMYIDLFSSAIKKVHDRGELALSSCSSHVSFSDFLDIIREAFSNVRKKGQILRISGQGSDHPFPHACPELRYLKFVHVTVNAF